MRSDDAVRWTALGFGIVDLALCIVMLAGFDTTTHEMQFVESRPWVAALGITYALGVDGISALFLFLTALLGLISVLASWVAIDRKVKEFMGRGGRISPPAPRGGGGQGRRRAHLAASAERGALPVPEADADGVPHQ